MITSLRSRSPGEERWGGKRGRKQRERAQKQRKGGLSRMAIRGWIESVKERTNESGEKGVWNI